MGKKSLKISLVVSRFYPDLFEKLKSGVVEELKAHGLKPAGILEVPGSSEIPLASRWLFQKNSDAVIALGVLIQGETDHYQSCCRVVEEGCLNVQMQFHKPLVLGVLMVKSKPQALARLGKKTHVAKQSVKTALLMLDIQKKLF